MTDRNSGCLAQANPGNLTPTYLNMAKECMKRKTEKLFTDKEWNSSFPSLSLSSTLSSASELSLFKYCQTSLLNLILSQHRRCRQPPLSKMFAYYFAKV